MWHWQLGGGHYEKQYRKLLNRLHHQFNRLICIKGCMYLDARLRKGHLLNVVILFVLRISPIQHVAPPVKYCCRTQVICIFRAVNLPCKKACSRTEMAQQKHRPSARGPFGAILRPHSSSAKVGNFPRKAAHFGMTFMPENWLRGEMEGQGAIIL